MSKEKILNEEYEIFEKFFENMIRRIEEKIPEYKHSWMDAKIDDLWSSLIRKFSKCVANESLNKNELDKDLIDLANQCMLLCLRKNDKGDKNV